MYITSISPSAFNTAKDCQMKYFISYLLRLREPSNVKAEIGTIIHAVYEICALHKKAQQDGVTEISHEVYGDDPIPAEDPMQVDIDELWETCWAYYVKHTDNPKGEAGFTPALKREYRKHMDTIWDSELDPRQLNIIATEQRIKVEIKEPWAKYIYWSTEREKEVSGYYAINAIVDLIVRNPDGTIRFIDWKGLPVDTPIPTPDGWSTMGDLKEGDTVFDQYGQPCRIVGKSSVKTKDCYKITFDDTTEVICDDEHLWKLQDGSTVDILSLRKGDKINVARPMNTKEARLPIDPYVLGIWLGDGRNRCGEICSGDSFVFEEITRRGYSVGDDIGCHEGSCSKTVYGLTTQLKELNLTHNKHIPTIYLRASFAQRLDLLRGLMDSDGNANPYRKQAVFTTCEKVLSDNVKELLLTLGQRPNQCKTKQTGFGLTVEAYPLHFRPIDINPFLLPRKADRIKEEWGHGKSSRRMIKSIEKVKQHDTQCIAVDSPDNTYLCTANMIPTHNSGQRKDWTTGKKKEYADLQDDIQLNLYYYLLKDIYPDDTIFVTIVYLKDGGPFDLVFTPESRKRTIKRVREQLEKLRNIVIPEQNKSFRCRWCHFSKTQFDDAPKEFRKGQFNDVGEDMCMCSHVHTMIKKEGMNEVIKKYRKPYGQ